MTSEQSRAALMISFFSCDTVPAMHSSEGAFMVAAAIFFMLIAYYFSGKKRRSKNPLFAVPIIITALLASMLLLIFGLGIIWWPDFLVKVGGWLN